VERSPAVRQVKMSPITQSQRPGCDITPSLTSLGVEDTDVRWAGVEAPPSMLAWDATWLVDLAGVVGGAAEVRAMAPTVAVLTLGERFAVFHVVVIGITPGAVKGVVMGAISPRVVEVVAGMINLIVGHVGKGGRAVNDPGSNVVIGIGVSEHLNAFETLFYNVFEVCS
jgi:hypothetical protein